MCNSFGRLTSEKLGLSHHYMFVNIDIHVKVSAFDVYLYDLLGLLSRLTYFATMKKPSRK